MNKKGFISMSLIYSFFIVFITILLALLSLYATNRGLLNRIKSEIKEDLIIVQIPEDEEQGTKTVDDGNVRVDYDANMIPVAYTSSGATVKADVTNVDSNYKWFNYNEKRWANAVLVTDATRKTYKTAPPGTPIIESDILGYFVYVPRYRYQLFNAIPGYNEIKPRLINVAFENKTMPKSLGTLNGSWFTHPAFTFGTTELNGFWVGKFEPSPEESSSCYVSAIDAYCNVTYVTPRIKPNKNSWKNINVSNMFTVTRYFKTNPMYGISNSTIDSHMVKNMEWAAIAYLSHSQYGKGSEVYINSYYSNYYTLTGCSGGSANASGSAMCPYPYPSMSIYGTGASTSGTVYGIYDMNGGAWEYVMGNMLNSNWGFFSGASGFASTWGAYNSKYYDEYRYNPDQWSSFDRGKLGDATFEILACKMYGTTSTCGWYRDTTLFPFANMPWFYRGGYAWDEEYAGLFAFAGVGGAAGELDSFRVVLAVE